MSMILNNAKIICADELIYGSLYVENGQISDISTSNSQSPAAIDLQGDYLLPGLIELHTDNLEKHFSPRPGVKWPAIPAVFAHDASIASAGITTVFNAVATGAILETSSRAESFAQVIDAVHAANESGKTRAEHLLHIRCELTSQPTMENFHKTVTDPLVKLVSVMDHSPGQRQFTKMEKYREYYQGKYNLSDAALEELIETQTRMSQEFGQQRRQEIAAVCKENNLALASHDDATDAHVAEAVRDGMSIAEFPTTTEAAQASHDNGLHVLMGAPNVVRGFSHSGNVSARDLAEAGLLDTISSDYVPASLLHSAFILADTINAISLPEAVKKISYNPAQAAGLNDRGEIKIGKKADLVQVSCIEEIPFVRQVWRDGVRVC